MTSADCNLQAMGLESKIQCILTKLRRGILVRLYRWHEWVEQEDCNGVQNQLSQVEVLADILSGVERGLLAKTSGVCLGAA